MCQLILGSSNHLGGMFCWSDIKLIIDDALGGDGES